MDARVATLNGPGLPRGLALLSEANAAEGVLVAGMSWDPHQRSRCRPGPRLSHGDVRRIDIQTQSSQCLQMNGIITALCLRLLRELLYNVLLLLKL